ncbi:MAG TPA: IclR family transcriptional regulator [Candidatus Aminicenantes bacterium]|nr:IclR family transcriptional regulator [Candidatus Aminicenantes bacterium]HRY65625.1 IclR family transcriptional regulator [Candidatus Aminicenantes bacterium]HRZ72487.1 IclR family transcriptional regulator [Candidatus Aminicenantes bacterium]
MTKAPKPAAAGGRGPYFSKIIEKGLRILTLFTPETPTLSLKDVTLKTRINPTSTFRFVETLVQLGYLRKDPATKLLKLGPMALAMSHNIVRSFDVLQIVKPLLDQAFARFDVTVDSALVEDRHLVLLYRREARNTLTLSLPLVSSDLHCSALGKAYLGALAEKDRIRTVGGLDLVRRTPSSQTTRAGLLADLKRTSERGYAVCNEEYVKGLVSIGAPLVNANGDVLGAVSFDTATAQYNVEEAEKRFAPAVLALAREIGPLLPI